ncbi:MAG: peptide chain release factor aRF-1 [Thermoplasmata archaeon]|nr:peptide chain release factor aRF-1 [Thermoplasmata archaeon]
MAKPDALARYEFKRQIRELQSIKGRATELITLYIPAKKQIHDIVSYLRNEASQSANIKSRTTKKNVSWAIESIMGRLKNFKQPPDNGLVFFVGHKAAGGDQTEQVTYVIEPPEPITTFLYRCDSYFYIDTLEDMLTEKQTLGMIVIDRTEATIGILNGKRLQVVKNIQSRIMGKHRQGGQSAQRFERLIEISAHEYYKKVAGIADDAFLPLEGLTGIVVGGPGATKNFFVDKNYLHHELNKKVLNTYDTGYTDEYGLKELLDNASQALKDLDISKEKELMRRFMAELRKPDGGQTAYGEVEVYNALNIGAVDTLLVSEGISRYRISYTCKDCEVTGKSMTNEPDSLKCKKCKSDVNIDEEADVIEELYIIAEGTGSTVELMSQDSEEGEMLMKAFNGLAAILRYKVG